MTAEDRPATMTSAMMQLGETVKTLRLQHGLTVTELADASNVSRRVVSNLEQGTGNPSLSTIDRIAGALDTDFPTLMHPAEKQSLIISSREAATVAWSSPRGSRAVLCQSTPQTPPAELWQWDMVPGDEYVAEPDPDGSYELFLILDGTLTIAIAEEGQKKIAQGQSGRLASNRTYTYRNDERTPLRFVRIVQLAVA